MRSSRRKFLNLGFWSTLAAIGGWMVGKKTKQAATGQKVRMITADGKVVEIEKKYLPEKQRGKPVTNEQLKDWMDSSGKAI